MDRNSSVNQTIKGKFVEREVYTNVNTMVEYILKKSFEDREAPFSIDDIENMNINNSDDIEELEEQIDELQTKLDELEEVEEPTEEQKKEVNSLQEQIEKLEDKKEELENEQDETQEVYEWWIVSNWLCRKLKEHGEVVIEDENIWGRCTTGQAILLDSVISDICEGMEILEGQQYEWKE